MDFQTTDEVISRVEIHAGVVNERVLSDSDIPQARRILSETEDMIRDLHIRTNALIETRKRYEERARKFSVALAPHKLLAPEILSEIFLRCLPCGADTVTHCPPSVEDAPWLLGHVCSLWRSVSRRDMRLWRNVSVQIFDVQAAHLFHAQELLPPFSRLNVSFTLKLSQYDTLWEIIPPDAFANLYSIAFNVELLGRLLTIVRAKAASQRWIISAPFQIAQRLRKLTVAADDLDQFLAIFSGIIPWHQLTHLEVSVDTCQFSSLLPFLENHHSLQHLVVIAKKVTNDTVKHVLNLPSLQSLSLNLQEIYPVNSYWTLWDCVWPRIINLDLLDVPMIDTTTLRNILKKCSRLKSLRCPAIPADPFLVVEGTIVLPQLENLFIDGSQGDWLLGSLEMPSLAELTVSSSCPVSFAVIRTMIILSQCSLRVLSLAAEAQWEGDISTLRGLLDCIPNAVQVNTGYTPLDADTLREIASGILLPHVQDLECLSSSGESFVNLVEICSQRELQRGCGRLKRAIGMLTSREYASLQVAGWRARLWQLKMAFGVECGIGKA